MHRGVVLSFVSISTIWALHVAGQTGGGDDASLESQLNDLEARIARYKLEHGADQGADAPLTQARAAAIRALVPDVLEDADARASLLNDGATAGWEGHPFFASADGTFRLQIEWRFQLRYVWSRQDDVLGVEDNSRGGFENRRIRGVFSGHVVDPSLTYRLQMTYSRLGGLFVLDDAYVQKKCDNGLYVQAGQSRPPFTRDVNVSEFTATAVERAIVHGGIEVERSQGIEVGWNNERFGLRGMFHDGEGLQNSAALEYDTEFALSARGEFLAAGEWSQFGDFTSWRGGDFGLLLGAGGHFERSESGTAIEEVEDCRWTADASAEFGGCHLYGAIGGRHIQLASVGEDQDILMAIMQGGFFITDTCELFGRFEWGDDDDAGGDDDLTILTVGGTKFWKKHDLKWTTDIGYAFEGVTGIFAFNSAGWREDPPGADGQIVLRSQFQLSF